MIKWLAVNEADMVRAIGDTKNEVMWDAENERINDMYQGFTPDNYTFVKAELIGDDKWEYDNWKEVK